MNRREWLKILAGSTAAVAATGSVVTPLPWLTSSADRLAFYAITPYPSRTVDLILSATNRPASSVIIGVRQVAPAPADLTIIRSGLVVDPASAAAPGALRHVAHILRAYQRPATHFVSVEPSHPISGLGSDRIVFEVDGGVVESIDRDAEYSHIEIRGAAGLTVFSLKERQVRVVSSSCRHKSCMRCGAVRSGRIICAPNRLVASVGNRGYVGFDTLTG